jgi:membrane-associated phospholipid phosphatase
MPARGGQRTFICRPPSSPARGLRTRWRAGGKATKIDAMTAQSFPPPIEDLLLERADRALGGGPFAHRALRDLSAVDHAVYQAIASTSTPTIDVPLRHLSDAANRSLIWVGAAGMLACLGGARGRRAAVDGLAAVGVSSAVVNVGLKQLAERTRPDRDSAGVIRPRHTAMPRSSSFPSGHSASGFAFATAIGREIPTLAIPLRVLAAAVAYSRVHSGVHYPGDVVVGSLVGGAVGLMLGSRRRYALKG